jgi:hypothetical protein
MFLTKKLNNVLAMFKFISRQTSQTRSIGHNHIPVFSLESLVHNPDLDTKLGSKTEGWYKAYIHRGNNMFPEVLTVDLSENLVSQYNL